jgi:Na+/H+ antiporter NhaD/arsenite permease-like protein
MTVNQIAACAVFAVTFALVLSERVHRTIVAMVGAAAMLLIGMLMGFYSQARALAAVDLNTLGLLLGMMILVRLLEQSGFFEYIAILTGKRSGGSPWRLLFFLGVATTVLSMFLDNVTTVVLIVPVTILIAEIMGISPLPLLMAEALLSNIGGVATLVGDPPNVLIGSASGLSFGSFLTHLGPIVLVEWLVAIVLLRLAFRHELRLPPRNGAALAALDEKRALRDPAAARKTLIVLGGVVLLFFLHGLLHLQPAFVALMGAAAALLWVQPDVEETLRHVEWAVLLFFAALFVITGGLQESGVLLLWSAAILSAIVDNIPFTIAMIPVIEDLGGLGIPIWAFWWALALGAGLGGNGTPIGATANVITVALSAKTQTPITTPVWVRSGLPVMLATCVVATVLFVLLFGMMSVP